MSAKILIVEDNVVNRDILVRILKDEYEVIQASDGVEALQIIREQHSLLAAVILDLLMPRMDGRELLRCLSQEQLLGHLPVLIATGEHNTQIESECLELGAWDFVTKPYNPIVIRLRLHNIIGRSQTYLMKKIQELAELDSLTGLYNRQYFLKKTEQLLKAHSGTEFVLIRLDIDQFRLYNSAFGTAQGDTLLCNIADDIIEKLRSMGEKLYTCGRISADIFCVCIPFHKEELEKELAIIEHGIQGMSSTYRLKITFGLCIVTNPEEELETIYAHTVEAARKCKKNLNGCFEYYDEKMSQEAEKAQLLANEFDKAIAERQFQVYLQPKYSIITEKPCGAEVLVRWKHPEWGMVSPGEFIPVYEKNGLIMQLDYYMWENTCILLQKWISEGRTVYPVSVNISRISMYNPKIVDQLAELTERYRIPRHLLNLEITESAYMSSPEQMKNILCELRNRGFVLMMDDFGSGYSSLNTLKDIDVDILKIDMKFLPSGHNNAKSEKILASVVRMAGWLGMPVIVEGVETKEQKDFLESIGCIYVQGYYYARPMPVCDYEELVEQQQSNQKDQDRSSGSLLKQFDELWSSDENTAAILKSVSIPFAIFEYANSQIDLLRMNQGYMNAFGNQSLEHYLMHQERYKLLTALDETVLSQEKSECECLFVLSDGFSKWYHIRLTYIGTVGKTSLISATFADVTTERTLERELNGVFSILQGKSIRKGSLLIVDDSELSREVLTNLFEEEYQIITARDGQEGLEILKERGAEIAAILLDMVMPKVSGQEFLSYKNNIPYAADIPVIVISSESNENTQIHMLENGVNDYVTKPFVPALVKKRLKNVMDYSSRFRTLVQEYHEIGSKTAEMGGYISLTGYSIGEVRNMIRFLSEIFDMVRLVDPANTAVITIEEDGTVVRNEYSCFSIWGKSVRCDNCTSQCAINGKCTLNKFELLKDDIFYVVSQPIQMVLGEQPEHLVMEIAGKISDETETRGQNADIIFRLLQSMHSTIYTDPLTGAYNRKYFDEMVFRHHGQNKLAHRIAFILIDLFQFQQISDLFGHHAGDSVLKAVTVALQSQLQQKDSLIRYGEDEFLAVLTECSEEQAQCVMERLQQIIATVKYGPNDTISLEADSGYAYTEDFRQSRSMLTQLLKTADEKLHQQKRIHGKKQELL